MSLVATTGQDRHIILNYLKCCVNLCIVLKTMNFTFNEEIDIPLISLTSHNDVSDSVKRFAIIGEFILRLKLSVVSCTI